MSNLLKPKIEFIEESPEVKSFIYQQLSDFKDFVTEETIVTVVAKDPKKLALQLETDGNPIPMKELKKMYRIAIVLREDDTVLQEEGLHSDIFLAIKQAKDKLLATLAEIQNEMMSNSDRQEQINEALENNKVH